MAWGGSAKNYCKQIASAKCGTNGVGGSAHNYCRYTGTGVVVTIVDDGMEHDHPDLEQNYDAEASTDLNGNDRDPYPNINDAINKHGKWLAATLADLVHVIAGALADWLTR
jgi:hypothetical protein